MKINLIKCLVSVVIATGVSNMSYAEEVPRSQQVITSLPVLTSQNAPAPAEIKNTRMESELMARAPAPPLSSMWVYAVGSTDCGWESTVGMTTTACDHGGEQLRTAVLEIGYGYNHIAWMNGGLLPSSTMYSSTPVCVTGSNYTWPCTAGQTVVGFLNEYNVDGHQNGLFKYQNTSTNSPWNTMSVQISIL